MVLSSQGLANTSPPSISGSPKVGQTLSATTGYWSAAEPLSYSYHWQLCNGAGEGCSDIASAIGQSYLVSASDLEKALRVVVTARSAVASGEVASAPRWVPKLERVTEYAYDANGNLLSQTNGAGHSTSYEYNADNEPIKVTQPDGATTKTEYDAAGAVVGQTDGNGHKTTYTRNGLEEVTAVTEPLGHRTTKTYDAAGNLTSLTNPEGQTTSYEYNADNRLVRVSYSDGSTPSVEYTYDANGNPTKMIDGTGTSTYVYNQLGLSSEATNGNGETTSYAYNLAGQPTTITYPGAKALDRTYNADGALQSVKDWLGNTTSFSYDAESNLTAVTFPEATAEIDHYTYDEAGQMSQAHFAHGSEALASLSYSRNPEGNIAQTVSSGLPQAGTSESSYDENGRHTKDGSTSYEYDPAGNPTQLGSVSQIFNEGDQLIEAGGTRYSYNQRGDRTEGKPASGPATTYAYNQAEELTSVSRPEEGSTPKIEDSFAYNGEGLRASETTNGTRRNLVWDTAEGLPLLLSDGTSSFIYGPGGLPIEQVNTSTGAVTYLHHDQAGSTRLLTGSTGKTEATFTYGPYGELTGSTGTARTPLGYDGQYTSSDTGLIYLRNRVYDPSTAQFLSVDPLEKLTGAPYSYGGDNPVNEGDPTGLLGWSEIGQAIGVGIVCVATDGAGCVAAGLTDLDANVVSNDYEAVAEPCRAGEEESSSLTELAGFALGAGVGGLADGLLSEEAKKALESTSAGRAALKQLQGLGAGSSALTTLAYAQGHESSGSSCSCGG